jgi:L-alanine-DL-glutamate epimerase-like enolase superfamily enzyme
MTRRELLKVALAVPAGAWLARFNALAAGHKNQLKITDIKAMQLSFGANNTLIKVETDGGVTGYGEAGSSGPMARARIETMKPLLVGQDPLSIERHFHTMSTIMHTYMAHIPTISGIDIALWDIAGKVTGRPVFNLLGGPFRETVPMYSHGVGLKDPLDKQNCRDWAQMIRASDEQFEAFKIGIDRIAGVRSAKYANTLGNQQLRNVHNAYMNLREGVGDDIDIAVHCHNEFDTPSAIAVAKAVEPMNPLFYEDALNVPFSEGWMALKRSTRLLILTGEKLEMVSGFRPFLDNQAADIVHPDLAFAGGFTGVKKIADYAALTRTPLALHNVGTIVLCAASGHFAKAIHNFYKTESALGRPTRLPEQMMAEATYQVKNGQLHVPDGPGLGLELDQEFIKSKLKPDEPWWG